MGALRRNEELMCNWTITARVVTLLLSWVLFVSVIPQSFGQALDAGSVSGVYFQIRGLDVSGNPIDKLINRFGFTCLDDLRQFSGDLCRVEREVAAFVNSLPHNRREMTEALTALGATCAGSPEKPIDCVYRKRVRTLGWITGEPSPRWIAEDVFVFQITADHEDEPFEAKVQLTRTTEK
jgi:hypothetical protein